MATTCSRYPSPAPPYSSSTVMPCTPSSPRRGHSLRGNWLLLSISAASGAISAALKARTLARSWSAVSPSPKLSAGYSLRIMLALHILTSPHHGPLWPGLPWLAPVRARGKNRLLGRDGGAPRVGARRLALGHLVRETHGRRAFGRDGS